MSEIVTRRFLLAALGGIPLAAVLSGRGEADQPQMHSALEHLRAALKDLEQASPDKGGHRGKAMGFVRRAIAEVEKGMAFDRRH